MSFERRPKAAEVARLLVALDRDERLDLAGRSARDEAFKTTLPADLAPWARMGRWLDQVDADGQRVTQDTEQRLGAISVALCALGAVVGWLALLAAFYYDGSARVNVLAVLAALLGVPLVTLGLSLLGRVSAKVSVLRGWAALLARPAAGRLALHLRRLLYAEDRVGVDALLGLAGHSPAGVRQVRYWLLTLWSHVFASAFFVAAIITALALVLFSDLAFGWSTTLALSASSVHAATAAVALPWLWLWPEAVPTLELVEVTRYFRLAAEEVGTKEAVFYGQWWPFVLSALGCYGLLPRMMIGLVAMRRLNQAIDALLVEHAGIRALLERLTDNELSGRRTEVQEVPPLFIAAVPQQHWELLVDSGPVVNWSGVPVSDPVLRQWLGIAHIHHAGAGISLEAEAALVKALQPQHGAVTLVCKSWEPPLLELQDFIDAVVACYPGVRIQVLPVRIDHNEPAPPGERDREVWQRSMAAAAVTLVGLRQWEGDR